MNMISTGSFLTGTDATKEQDTLAGKFAAVWEKKNAKAARAGGVSLMALTLAACGSSSDDTAADAGAATDAATEEAATETATTTTLTALQSQAGDFLKTIAASDVAVEAATIAGGATSVVMTVADTAGAGTNLAPATAAAATTAFDAAATAIQAEIDPATAAVGDGLESSNGIGTYATTTFATLATMLANDTAVTAAQKTALATADASLSAAFAFEASSDAAALMATQVAANAATALNATTTPAAAALAAIGTHTGANLANTILRGDNVAATAAETLAGQVAFAGVLHAAILGNNAAYATEFGNLSAANQTIITDAIAAYLATAPAIAATNVDANSGAITGFVAGTDPEVIYTGAIAAVNATVPGAALVNQPAFAGDVIALAATELDAIVAAAEDQAMDAAFIAAYESLLSTIDTIAAADAASQVAAIEAGNVATVTLGADNVDINGGAGTNGNDVFIFNEANGNMTIGTAATAAAPGNVLFGAGEDSVLILGEYTDAQFVTIATAAEQAAIATTEVGDASVLEIFVYQNATTGDTVLTIEENSYDGSTTAGTAMTTLTLTDVTWTGVEVTAVDGMTLLTAAEAVVA